MRVVEFPQAEDSRNKYELRSWQSVRLPLPLGKLRGHWWLPFSRGKLLRLFLGTYELEQSALISAHLWPGSVLFDVGAAAGYYTVLAAPRVGHQGHVVAFEPDPQNAAFLRKHVQINRLRNVDVYQTAIGNRTGRVCFASGTGTGTGHLTQTGDERVAIWKLDDLVGRIRMPTHMKIDVEGAELDVLKGARNVLRGAKPILFLSTHGADIHQACYRYLSELGYAIESVSSDPKRDSEILCTFNEAPTASSAQRHRAAA